MSADDPDLIPPGRAERIPRESVFNVNGRPAIALTIGPEAWASVQHNRARYGELQALRLGQPNRYQETRYRHG